MYLLKVVSFYLRLENIKFIKYYDNKYSYKNNLRDLLKLLREILQKWGKL